MEMARKRPSFFKVLVDDFSRKLQIPPNLYIRFLGRVPRCGQFLLRNPAGTWKVHVEKVGDRSFFHEGWKKFARDNGLKLCEFLVFRYAGDMKFDVDIYGVDGCKKEYAVNGITNCLALYAIKEEETECKPVMHLVNEPDTEVNHQLSEDSETRLPKESRNQVENPFFRVVLQPAYVNKNLLNVPASFKTNFDGKKSVKLIGSEGRLWVVKCIQVGSSVRLSRGWAKFMKDHALKVGDECLFELVKREDAQLKVSITRCIR